METDVLNYAYRAVLSQKQADNRHHPIGFMSKSMNPAEHNYGIPDKEALAIVKGRDTGSSKRNFQFKSSLTTRISSISQSLVFSIDDRCAGWSC